MNEAADHAQPASRRTFRHPTLCALAVLAATWALLELGRSATVLHADTFEDLLLARECLEEGRCSMAGVSTAFRPLEQGALWVSLLAVLRGWGLSIAAIRSVTFALAAAGTALVYREVRLRFPPEVAWGTAALLALELLLGEELHVAWNPSLTPLAAALLFVSAIRHAETGHALGVLMLGVALGLVIETHPAAILCVPGALVVSGAAAERRWIAIAAPALTGAVALALYASISPLAAEHNATWALSVISVPGAIVGALALTLAVVPLRSRFRAAAPAARALAAAIMLVVPTLMALIIGAVVVDGVAIGTRYAAAIIPAAAFLIARACAPVLRARAVQVGFVGVVLAWALHLRVGASHLSQEALDETRSVLQAEGVTLDEAWALVSGPQCGEVLGGLAALGLPILAEPSDARPTVESGDGSRSWIVRPASELGGVSPSALARGEWRVISTRAGGVLIGELDTWVERARFSVCVFTDRAGDEPTCREVDMAVGVRALSSPEAGITRLDEPEIEWRSARQGGDVARRAVYRLPVRVPVAAGTRTLVAQRGSESCLAIRFMEVEGVETPTRLPAERIVLAASDTEQHGLLVVEVDRAECTMHSLLVFPPCLSEVATDDDATLRRLLQLDRD